MTNNNQEEITSEEIEAISGYEDSDLNNDQEELLDPSDYLNEEEEKEPAQNPLLRFALIGTFVFLILGAAGWVWLMFAGNNQAKQEVPDWESEEVVAVEDSPELAELKAELALRDQQLPEAPPPQKQISKIEAQPQPQKIPPQPKPVIKRQLQPIVNRQPVIQPQSPVKKVDPQKRWEELAQIGSSQSPAKTEALPLQANQPQPRPNPNLIASHQLISHNQASLPPQKAIAILEGGIAVPASTRSSQKLTVAIVLSEPLVDRNAKEVVPQGAIILAEVSSNSSVMEFIPKTLTFEKGEQYYELNLNQNSIVITGKNGPVIASMETIGADGQGLSLAQWGQLAALTGSLGDTARDFSLIFNALGMNNRSSFSRNRGVQLYTVPEGTEVVVRIVRNLPFNLSSGQGNSRLKIPVPTSYQPPVKEFDFEKKDDDYQQELDFEGVDNYDPKPELDFEY